MKLSTSILSAVLGLTTLVAALPQSSGNLFERQTTSPDNTCGLKEAGANRGYRCPASDKCCSQYGWCGNTDAYCGTGCQPGYGACNGVTPPPTTTTTIRTTSTTSTRPTTSTTSIRTTSTTSIRTTSTTSIRTTTTPTPSPTGRPRPGSVPYGVQISQCSVPGVVALTFDDGPFAYTQELLNLLARHNVKATFFVNGQNWGAPITTDATQQQTLRNMYAAGHHIASHTFAHPDLSGLSAADMRTQMLTLETALKNIIGVYPTYMRPPYFSCSGTCFQVMNELSYHVIYANIDPLDWQYNTDATNWQAQNIFNNAVSSIPASQGRWIVLNHDVHATTVRQLAEYEIVRAKALGYRLVTVGECMGDPQANWYRV